MRLALHGYHISKYEYFGVTARGLKSKNSSNQSEPACRYSTPYHSSLKISMLLKNGLYKVGNI